MRLTDAGVGKLRELQVTHHRIARELFLARLSERDLAQFACGVRKLDCAA